MRNISRMGIIQIDVTNVCDRSCANCTRFCGHHRRENTYFMDLDHYEKAVKTLVDFPGMVGMIGGEPTLHPQFPELCDILNTHIKGKDRKGLWTNSKNSKYRDIIDATFGYCNHNDHVSNEIIHTPILVASEDLIKDGRLSEEQWRKYTDSCWVQATWSATITPKGAFFCEVAGTLDHLFGGDCGWDIDEEPQWWRKKVPQYADQIAWACRKCGCQLPLRPRRSSDPVDDVSPSNLQRLILAGSPKVAQGRYELFSEGLDPNQVRSETWYWNRKRTLLGAVKKSIRALLGRS